MKVTQEYKLTVRFLIRCKLIGRRQKLMSLSRDNLARYRNQIIFALVCWVGFELQKARLAAAGQRVALQLLVIILDLTKGVERITFVSLHANCVALQHKQI